MQLLAYDTLNILINTYGIDQSYSSNVQLLKTPFKQQSHRRNDFFRLVLSKAAAHKTGTYGYTTHHPSNQFKKSQQRKELV